MYGDSIRPIIRSPPTAATKTNHTQGRRNQQTRLKPPHSLSTADKLLPPEPMPDDILQDDLTDNIKSSSKHSQRSLRQQQQQHQRIDMASRISSEGVADVSETTREESTTSHCQSDSIAEVPSSSTMEAQLEQQQQNQGRQVGEHHATDDGHGDVSASSAAWWEETEHDDEVEYNPLGGKEDYGVVGLQTAVLDCLKVQSMSSVTSPAAVRAQSESETSKVHIASDESDGSPSHPPPRQEIAASSAPPTPSSSIPPAPLLSPPRKNSKSPFALFRKTLPKQPASPKHTKPPHGQLLSSPSDSQYPSRRKLPKQPSHFSVLEESTFDLGPPQPQGN